MPVAVITKCVCVVAALYQNVGVVFRQLVKGLLFQCSVATYAVSVGNIYVSVY
jgi:hypothetical protein